MRLKASKITTVDGGALAGMHLESASACINEGFTCVEASEFRDARDAVRRAIKNLLRARRLIQAEMDSERCAP